MALDLRQGGFRNVRWARSAQVPAARRGEQDLAASEAGRALRGVWREARVLRDRAVWISGHL